ncbi:MAG: hypothetical protein KI785_07280 [Devosiaceae bacterium]|nr:hypothetical protein [Devosiaceae bacterium MH13]
MPIQNRVHPDGGLHAIAARGEMFGNRGGRFHTADATLPPKRRWASRRWICCVLSFKGRQRTVWSEGYTELFFLDEVTALAAGHRPCFECRRSAAKAFAQTLFGGGASAYGWPAVPSADAMDLVLHTERLEANKPKARLDDLPKGAIVRVGDRILALGPDGPLDWSFSGYTPAGDVPSNASVDLLTPPAMLHALRAGYRPQWHSSAGDRGPADAR